MSRTVLPCALVVGFLLAAGTAARAQVSVSHDDSAALTQIKSPMKIEVGLGASTDAKGASRPPMNEGGPKIQRIFSEVSRYRVDKAGAKWVSVRREYVDDTVIVTIGIPLSTEWTRQDVDLKISLLSGDKEVDSKSWEGLTIGNEASAASKMGAAWASGSKTPEAVFRLKRTAWDAMFAGGAAPSVRVVIAIEE